MSLTSVKHSGNVISKQIFKMPASFPRMSPVGHLYVFHSRLKTRLFHKSFPP